MKYSIIILYVFMSWSIVAQTSYTFTVNIDGVDRTYRQYVPAIYDGDQPVPVVFNFHGYGSSAIEQELYANFKPIADTANFIIVFPQGLVDGNGNTFWNDFSTMEELQIDLDFFDVMLDSLNAQFNIDLNRIYSTGMSNGGFFSYDLACHRNTTVAAIASVSGTMISNHLEECESQIATPVLHFHGTADNVVYYGGNGGIINALGAEEIVQHWVEFNQCDESPIVTDVPDTNTLDGSTVEHYLYENGMNGSAVEFYKIIGGGHSWPGSLPLATLGNTNQDIDACEEIWRFFSQYQLDNLVEIEQQENIQIKFELYPNPVSDKIIIGSKGGFFVMSDLSGKIVLEKQITLGDDQVDISYLPQGMFIYRFTEFTGNQSKGKIIIE